MSVLLLFYNFFGYFIVSIYSQRFYAAVTDFDFKAGKWYHLIVQHRKRSLIGFGGDELTVYVDGNIVCKTSLPFIKDLKAQMMTRVVGMNFNGQMVSATISFDAIKPSIIYKLSKVCMK